ncbi:hypothetical protein [Pseudonocardia acidicola]|uniref:TetR family transcriptional regulator n=1 Tax=Pseudonocardia acidicola TaxID=2724939 RepID=A0ABX1SIV9_9PSEU|nr:hypothetical protein [Pseudonocardia acidicola]NMI00996.1 hypothetical protein [Pseudonocardia acidicola]
MTASTTSATMPAGFADLERFAEWVLPNEAARIEARLTRPYAESKTFYDTMLAEVPRIMPHLLGRTSEQADDADRNLLALTLAYIEIANAVEIYGESEVPDGADLRLFVSVLDSHG